MDKCPQVLIVDDSEDDALLLVRELCKNGYEPVHLRVDSAETMRCALNDNKWDVVLSDCSLFNFSSLSALEVLKDNGHDLPFILVSKKIDEETAVELMRAGAHDYFEKGNLTRLVSAIEREMAKAEEKVIRQKVEELLHRSEERFRLINTTIDEVFWILDMQNKRLDYISPGFERVWGYPRLNLYKDPGYFVNVIHPDDRSLMLRNLELQELGQPSASEYRIIRPDGEVRWIFDRGFPVWNESRILTSYVGVAHDITERKRAEEERKKLEEQLLQSQKMEAIGQLTGGIAHDFNNILTAITGFGSLMKSKMDNSEPHLKYLEQILAAADRAVHLTQSLLAYSRKQIMTPKPVDLNEVIRVIEKFLRRVIREEVQLSVETSTEPLIIHADSMQIEQVLMNLATNARDAMPNGGTIVVETSTFAIDDAFINTHGFGTKGHYAMLSLTDSGIGMDAATSKRIFEPFFTTKEVGKGTGLGLSVVYGIIKQHDGFIVCDSQQGRGTAFRIYLPLIEGRIEQREDTLATLAPKGTETILLAEDDAPSRTVSRLFLENYGYKVIEATNGVEAVSQFIKHRNTISLALMDVSMPRMNGWEAFKSIEEIAPGTRVLFVSGYVPDTRLQDEMARRGISLLSKPALDNKLLEIIRHILDAGENGQ